MIGQWVGQSRVEQPQGVATTGRFVWRTNELCRRARGESCTRAGLVGDECRACANQDACVGARGSRFQAGPPRYHPAPTPTAAGRRPRPRSSPSLPPRSCSYLDDELMNREMYDHVREEPIRLISRLGFRLRR